MQELEAVDVDLGEPSDDVSSAAEPLCVFAPGGAGGRCRNCDRPEGHAWHRAVESDGWTTRTTLSHVMDAVRSTGEEGQFSDGDNADVSSSSSGGGAGWYALWEAAYEQQRAGLPPQQAVAAAPPPAAAGLSKFLSAEFLDPEEVLLATMVRILPSFTLVIVPRVVYRRLAAMILLRVAIISGTVRLLCVFDQTARRRVVVSCSGYQCQGRRQRWQQWSAPGSSLRQEPTLLSLWHRRVIFDGQRRRSCYCCWRWGNASATPVICLALFSSPQFSLVMPEPLAQVDQLQVKGTQAHSTLRLSFFMIKSLVSVLLI